MWQRIQTLYFAISALLAGSLFFVPVAEYKTGGSFLFTNFYVYIIFAIILIFLNLLALLTFKIRIFQMRTAMLAALISLAFQGWICFDFFHMHDSAIFKFYALFPFVIFVLDLLAYRGVLADHLLVESAYCLRKARSERRLHDKKRR